jgi:hypothetical protein
VDFTTLRFHWSRGIIAQNLRLQRADHKPGPMIFVEEAGCRLNQRALRNLDFQVDSVLLRDGQILWQFAETNQPTATFQLDKIGGELVFEANDLWRLRSLRAEMLGTSVQLSGTLTNASRVRDWKFPKKTVSAGATQALWRKIMTAADQVKLAGEPQLLTRIAADAGEPRNLDADLKFGAAAMESPWGNATNPVLHVRILPAQPDEPLHADLELTAEQTTTRWGEARKLRLTWEVEPPFSTLFPTNAHVTVDLLAPETTWAKARHVAATVHLLPGADATGQIRTEVQATIEQLQSQWGRSDFARLNTSIQHEHTNFLPATVSADLRVSNAKTDWGEALGAVISANGKLPAPNQLHLFQTNLLWPERLSNLVFSSSLTASNVSGHDLQIAFGSVETAWDSRQLSLRTTLDLYGGTLTATGRVDAETREATFGAKSNVDPYELVSLLTPKGRTWLSNYTWKAAPALTAGGRVILPAWTNRHPDWKAEVRPTLSLAGHFQVGEGAYRDVTFISAASPFTLTNLFWRIPDLRVVRPEGTLRGEYSTALATRDFHWSIASRLDPKVVRSFLTKDAERKVLDDFQFTEPPLIIGEVWNRWGDTSRLGINALVRATNVTFRGEEISEVGTGLTYTNKILTFVEPSVRQGSQQATCPKISLDLAAQRLSFTNASGNLNPHAVAHVIGKNAEEAIAPYRFDSPPRTRVYGVVDLKKGRHEDNLHFDISGGPFRWRQFRLQQLSGNVDWVADRLSLNNLQGAFRNGAIGGAAAFNFAPGQGANFAFNIGILEADLRTLMPDIGYPTNRLEGFLNGELIVRKANTSDMKSWQGEGNLRLRDGLIWDIPMFGVFSPVLNSIIPGLGNSRAKDAVATFVITNSVIVSHDLEIRATAMRMNFDGTITFDGDVDARIEAELLRDVPAIGIVVSKVLWPITKLFEYRITGAVNRPQTEPLYIVPKLLVLPFLPFKILKEMIPEVPSPPAPP